MSAADALPAPAPIRDYEGVDRRRFLDEIRPLGQPAVMRGLAADWPAVRAARRSPDELAAYLRPFTVAKPVEVLIGKPDIGGRFFYAPGLTRLNFDRGAAPLGDVLEQLVRSRDNPKPHAIAVQSAPVPELLPGFREQNDLDLVEAGAVPRAWLGNRARVALHYDVKENVGVVVAGRRRFLLFPAGQIANLYPGPFELTPAGTPVSLVDPAAPDLDAFPRYRDAASTAQAAELEPGDAIYIPYHWWHGVDSLEPVNLFVNYWWNPAMPGLGAPYDALLHAIYALRHLPPEQREVWRQVFDHHVFGADPAEHLPPEARGILGPPTPELLERMRTMLRQILSRL